MKSTGIAGIAVLGGAVLVALVAVNREDPASGTVEAAPSKTEAATTVATEPLKLKTPLPSLDWPFSPMAESHVYQTFGQPQSSTAQGGGYKAHAGLDLQCDAGTSVYAPAAGRVVMMYIEEMREHTKALVIELDGFEAELLQVQHLELGSIQFGLDDHVERGDLLGEVALYPDKDTFVSHLHMSVAKNAVVLSHVWDRGSVPRRVFEATVNPLGVFPTVKDTDSPVIHSIGNGGPFRLRSITVNAEGCFERGPKLVANNGEPNKISGLVDIEIAVSDLMHAGARWRVLPYELVVELRSLQDLSIVRRAGIRMEREPVRPEPEVKPVCDHSPLFVGETVGPHQQALFVFSFMALNRLGDLEEPSQILAAPGNCRPLDTSDLPPGLYQIDAFVRDMAGGNAVASMTVLLGE